MTHDKNKKRSLKRILFRPTAFSLLSFAFIVLSLSLVVSTIIAQQATPPSRTIVVSPPSQELSGDPGQTIEAKAKITNKNNQPIDFNVKIEDFTASGEGGQVNLTDKGSDSVSTWTTLDSDKFSLGAGETKEVTAKIAIPKNAGGGYYGAFVFQTAGGQPGANSAIVNQELASLFLIRVNGPVNEKLTLTSFKVPSFVENGPVTFEAGFHNEGNVHVKPHGLINVTDITGRTVKDVVFSGENVFPGASRIINASLDNRFLIGPYKVTATFYYGQKNDTITASTSFFAFPVRLATLVLIGLGILFLLRKRIIRSLKVLFG